MKKHNLIALLMLLMLMLSGCRQESGEDGTKEMDELFVKTGASLEEGHIFFTGKVLSAMAEERMISFYEAETAKSTFYTVEVTDDPFGCLPDRTITVCVLGNSDNFLDRTLLKKNKEYIFDTTFWVLEDQAVLLLPTFYLVLPDREGDHLYYTSPAGSLEINGTYQDYWAKLKAMADERGYSAEKVLTAAKDRLEDAVQRDAVYFQKLKFQKIDVDALVQTVETAKVLLDRAKNTQPTWEGIKELLK